MKVLKHEDVKAIIEKLLTERRHKQAVRFDSNRYFETDEIVFSLKGREGHVIESHTRLEDDCETLEEVEQELKARLDQLGPAFPIRFGGPPEVEGV